MIHFFVPTTVGPSKLDLVLSYCTDLSDEGKERVIIITDIGRIAKLMGVQTMKAEDFYMLYELPMHKLHEYQHDAQIAYNTKEYQDRVYNSEH